MSHFPITSNTLWICELNVGHMCFDKKSPCVFLLYIHRQIFKPSGNRCESNLVYHHLILPAIEGKQQHMGLLIKHLLFFKQTNKEKSLYQAWEYRMKRRGWTLNVLLWPPTSRRLVYFHESLRNNLSISRESLHLTFIRSALSIQVNMLEYTFQQYQVFQ